MQDKVKEFWDTQAIVHKADGRATAPDHFYREMEVERILEHIDGRDVLDVGCGNGYSTIKFAKAKPQTAFMGLDYSDSMIAEAKKLYKFSTYPNLEFRNGDVRRPLNLGQFDSIISERCLINLANWGEQQQALLNMKAVLNPKGKIILVENTIEGLKRLNTLRNSFGLPDIEVRWHNHYLPQQDLIDFCAKHFNIEYVANIGGLYYVISRVVYAAMCAQDGVTPSYDHPINEMASKLPFMPCPYSPNMMFILRNKP